MSETCPTLHTPRLVLRPLTLDDAPDVQRLAGAREVAATTRNIPHPYEDGMAEAWISGLPDLIAQGKRIPLAITLRSTGAFIGTIALGLHREDDCAELGYWIGVPYWNQGYCTEAAATLLEYGFRTLGLNRIFAAHLARNPASGRVMAKIGMVQEGCLRQHIRKWGAYEDIIYRGVLREEYEAAQAKRSV